VKEAGGDNIVVLFSGGSDSTLAAALAADQFKRIHLVTYSHAFMAFHEKIEINVKRLKKHYPENEFIRHHHSINPLFKRLYFKNYLFYFRRFGTMIVPWICGACKLAMHVETIKYCKKRNLRHVSCGANRESSGIFPAQMKPVIEQFKKLYERHGIEYRTPVYQLERTDRLLLDMGIVKEENLKDQHLFYTTQHTCPLGILLHAHSRLYYTRIHGLKRYREKAARMMREKILDLEGRKGVT